ncbi:Pyruvate/Phosphoenolpyruvate kinase-like domain-containing protein [Aspergillus californicus]
MYTPEAEAAEHGSLDTLSFQDAIRKSQHPLLGAILAMADTTVAKITARAGFQWVMIDAEHSPFSMAQVTELVHAVSSASGGKCLPLVRIPSHGTEYIKWALDSGAAGIIVPMVQTPEEMEDIIQRSCYPPRGTRSFGPYQAPFADPSTRSFAHYYRKAQDQRIAILPILESRQAVRNAEAIMSVNGVTGAFIGPYDLRLSQGLPGGSDGDEAEFVDAVTQICRIGKRLGKPVGSMGSSEALARKTTHQGMDFLLVSFDYNALIVGYRAHLDAAKSGVHQAKTQLAMI